MASSQLTDRVAVVTGASSGLGERATRALHAAGALLVVAARREERLRALAEDLPAATWVACDVASEADRVALIETAVARYSRIDVLVNNAGIAQSVPADEESLEWLNRVIAVNLIAPYRLAQLAAGVMRRGGSIVNIASFSALRSVDRYPLASYVASKAGLVGLTRELAAQWGGRGIRVNAIGPGWFPTEVTGDLADPDQVAWINAHTAMGRPGRLDEIDGPLLFLASDASSYVTGQLLLVDGGWTVY